MSKLRKQTNKKKVNNRNIITLIGKYDNVISQINEYSLTELLSKYKVLLFNIEDKDLKIRFSNSYIIDGKKPVIESVIEDNSSYLIFTNDIVSLIYRDSNEYAVMFRNNKLVRIYKVPDYLHKDLNLYLKVILNEILENPSLVLGN